MRRSTGRRLVTLLAILLVATSLSTRGFGASECDCCGPMMAAPVTAAPPCCVGTYERRVAVSTTWHSVHSVPVFVKTLLSLGGPVMLDIRQPPYPPGRLRPLYLSISVLQI